MPVTSHNPENVITMRRDTMHANGLGERGNEMQVEAKQKEESQYMMERATERDRVMKDGHDRSIERERDEFPEGKLRGNGCHHGTYLSLFM